MCCCRLFLFFIVRRKAVRKEGVVVGWGNEARQERMKTAQEGKEQVGRAKEEPGGNTPIKCKFHANICAVSCQNVYLHPLLCSAPFSLDRSLVSHLFRSLGIYPRFHFFPLMLSSNMYCPSAICRKMRWSIDMSAETSATMMAQTLPLLEDIDTIQYCDNIPIVPSSA